MEINVKVFNDSPPIESLVNLGKSYYDSGEIISQTYLNWQYNDNPFGKPFYSLAYDGDAVIGQYMVIPLQYRVGGNLYKGTLSLNTLTHPNYQGKGLFTKMASETYRLCGESNVKFTVGFPNPLSYGGFVKKLGFKSLGNVGLLVSILRPFPLIKDQLKKNKQKHGGDIDVSIDFKQNKNCQFSMLTKDDQILYDTFWRELSTDSSIITVDKSWNYIKWRYFDIPKRKYYPVKCTVDGQIVAVCIFRTEKVLGTNTAVIMDFLMKDSATGVAKDFLKELKRNLRKNKVNLMSILQSVDPKKNSLLKQLAFFRVPKQILPQPIPYIFRPHVLEEVPGVFEYFDNWDLAFGDYDIF